MKTWVAVLLVLTALVIGGGCSSSAPEVSAALAPATDAAGSGTRIASALDWGSPIVVDSQAGGGRCLAMIDGNPAVSYVGQSTQGQTTYQTLFYVRANDSTGSTWGRSQALDSWTPGHGNCFTAMCVVNGNPAVGYVAGSLTAESTREVRYVRANDSIGKKWGTPVEVNIDGDNGVLASMMVVNGKPAITYGCYGQSTTFSGGKYVRALDQNGETWGAPVRPGPGGGMWIPLAIVGGRPAVSQGRQDCGGLSFIRADDIDGNSWGSPIPVAGSCINHELGVVNGNPAITFSKNNFYAANVLYIRALDADGTTWPSETIDVTIDGDASVEWLTPNTCAMRVINGLPSIVCNSGVPVSESPPYYQFDELSLKFVQALDSSGSAWETPETIANTGQYAPGPSLVALESGAGIAFTDEWRATTFIASLPAPPPPPDPAVDVQLSTDKSGYIIGEDFTAVLTAVVTDEYGDPISGLLTGAFATTLDGGGLTLTFSESATAGTYTGSLDISGLTADDYAVETTVTDTRAVSGSDSAAFSLYEPGSGGTMHVGDLDAEIVLANKNRWCAVFTVMIEDSSENPVSGADVSFSLSGDESGNGQAITGSEGTASYQTGWINGSGSVTFTVNDVTLATYTYSPGDNHDPDEDSDGTSIEAFGP